MHALGSLNWVTDDRRYETPLLGEVSPLSSTDRPYRNGKLAIPRPPAVLVGTADCLAGGETYPVPLVERTLTLGIDSRCYKVAPLAPADAPWAWHRPEEIATIPHGGAVKFWEDVSGNARHLRGQGNVVPVKDNFGQRGRVFFTGASRVLNWQILSGLEPKYPPFGQYSVYFHGHSFSTAGARAYGPRIIFPNPSKGGTSVALNVFNISDSLNTITVGSLVATDAELVFAVRRAAGSWEMTLTGQPVTTGILPHPAGLSTPQGIGAGIKTGQPALNRACFIDEMFVYDRLLTDDEHAVNLAYLAARYP